MVQKSHADDASVAETHLSASRIKMLSSQVVPSVKDGSGVGTLFLQSGPSPDTRSPESTHLTSKVSRGNFGIVPRHLETPVADLSSIAGCRSVLLSSCANNPSRTCSDDPASSAPSPCSQVVWLHRALCRSRECFSNKPILLSSIWDATGCKVANNNTATTSCRPRYRTGCAALMPALHPDNFLSHVRAHFVVMLSTSF